MNRATFIFLPIIILFIGTFVGSAQNVPEVSMTSAQMKVRLETKPLFGELPARIKDFHAIGTISLRVIVGEDGNVEKSHLIGGFKDFEFMKSFFETESSKWKFTALEQRGRPVRYVGMVYVTFCYGRISSKTGCLQ